ncbi:hypothetical protein J4405_04565 [Candidatus Woesearchaeota archaeon]|nr:hypothetical protein [Candidatus Woesearchaeota archaeon]
MKLKKDKYSAARDGNSHFLELFCFKCNNSLLTYQKDGKGSLLRLYLDRIIEPEELTGLQLKFNKKDLPELRCSNCKNLIGIPMIYKNENRIAFRLIPCSFSKKNK